jgi:hypothetical protein
MRCTRALEKKLFPVRVKIRDRVRVRVKVRGKVRVKG